MKIAVRTLILLALVLLAILRSWWGTRLDSFTNDEPFHIVAGAYYVETGDFRLNPEHPPLVKLWVGLWTASAFDLPPYKTLKDKDLERDFLQEIMFFEHDSREIQKISRWSMWTFHALLTLAVGLVIWYMFGGGWAVLTLAWMALEPSLGAHLPVVMTDMPLALTMLLTILTTGLMVSGWKWWQVIICGLALGLTLATKHSALPGVAAVLILGGVFAIWPVFKKRYQASLQRIGKLVIAGLIALLTLWASYGFKYHSSPGGQDAFNRTLEQKIEDLNLETWRVLIGLANRLHLLPRTYLWGLADTVRAGIEGRGQDEHYLFGKIYQGRPAIWHWPGIIAGKVPLPLLLMALIGLVVIGGWWWKSRKSGDEAGEKTILAQKRTLVILLGMMAAHLIVLSGGQGTYGGIRHALPVVAGLGLLAGGLIRWQPRRFPQAGILAATALLSLTALSTFEEKRLWEYYNELAGGTTNAYKNFWDEGVYLGQRFYEIEEVLTRPEIDSTAPVFVWGWIMEEEKDASSVNFSQTVQSIYDDNYEGILRGYFVLEIMNFVPGTHWDPAKIAPLNPVERVGNLMVMEGCIQDPQFWAYDMGFMIEEYLRTTPDPDWELLRQRSEEVVKIITWNTMPFVHLGNAHLRLGNREAAMEAYEKGLANIKAGDPYDVAIKKQIESIKAAQSLDSVSVLRSVTQE